jgi:hypothetical protein
MVRRTQCKMTIDAHRKEVEGPLGLAITSDEHHDILF